MANLRTNKLVGIGSTDAGVVFDGPIKINTQGAMYFPTGDTSQRGRGRGLYGGGAMNAAAGQSPANIAYIDIQSQGNTTTFGSLTASNRCWIHGFGSATRAVWSGGSASGGTSSNNIIDYVTIATTANAIDFGDATVATFARASHSNDTRGITACGGPAAINTMEYVTVATTGNAADFGDASVGRRGVARMGSTTRGVWAGGMTPSASDVMDYVTIATTGNATDFGNLVVAGRHDSGGCSSNTRGIVAGGNTSPADVNTIQYITIATTGNAADFGDLQQVQEACGSLDNSIRGVFSGSYANPASINTMNFITIATTGNAFDFGDNTASNYAAGGTSDSHGGLS